MIIFTDADILKYCGKRSYEKGRTCANTDDFIKIFIQENALFGLYQGSVGTYRVNIIFDKDKPCYTQCTCPSMGVYDDHCKHIAGLLILWNKSSRKFTPLHAWKLLLTGKARDELVALITITASKSIDAASALYEQLGNDPLIDRDELYDGEDEW